MADLLTLLSDRLAPVSTTIAARRTDSATSIPWCVRPITPTPGEQSLPLAKQLGRNPQTSADILAAADLESVATAEIAGPGFINLTVDNPFLSSTLAGVAADEHSALAGPAPKRIVVDYSAPNVAKQMPPAPATPPPSADALVRMLEFLGHDVVRENHIGASGRPSASTSRT